MALGQSKFQSTLPTRGSDPRHNTQSRPPRGFNPRSPRGGATRHQHKLYISYRMFQSTLPTRGSDHMAAASRQRGKSCFNPRSPRGGATKQDSVIMGEAKVSIHAPHEGERLGAGGGLHCRPLFQSTLPTRGSDHSHAPLRSPSAMFQSTLPTRGSDLCTVFFLMRRKVCFNPRSPRGGATRRCL